LFISALMLRLCSASILSPVECIEIPIWFDYTLAMPVTKTAKRALRGSKRKASANVITITNLEVAVRHAKKSKSLKDIFGAISLADKAAKKRTIHKNKAARIKSSLSKLLPKSKKPAVKAAKKSPKKKK